MALELVTVPCLTDNFAFLLHEKRNNRTLLIDAPEAAPVLEALERRGWPLDLIVLTHHHDDHVQAVPELCRATGADVWGAKADAHRLPPLTRQLHPGSAGSFMTEAGLVIDVPGHTVGHIAIHFPDSGFVFTGDSLMAAGCGRLFEGSPEQMWQSLSKLAALPPETLVCSGHDYLNGNLAFAAHLEPGNAAITSRAGKVARLHREGLPAMPWTLAEELATNPFLRAGLPEMKAALGMEDASDLAVFTEIRARKDKF
ncbi:hydroxyacylglutathione hydrolase [Pseudogemmobacter sonorensis]|uniref:hydroxyacylglutathione hydrolase n=1 Tax=Pseudogemmobacter sonorensis TaxID=2989681 RepID=UPI0036AF4EF4